MGRNGGRENMTSKRRVEAQARSFKALKLRKEGLSYREIAEEVGYAGPPGAYQAVKRVLDDMKEEMREMGEDVRALELGRLDCALNAIFDKVKDGNLASIKTMLAIMDRRSKFMGLDAPARSEVSGPGGGPIERRTTSETKLDRELAELVEELSHFDKGSSEGEAKATVGDGAGGVGAADSDE